MQASTFYNDSVKKSTPFTLIPATLWHTFSQSLSISLSQLFLMQGFQAKLGDMVLERDDTGHLSHVYVGQGNSTDSEAIAEIISRLPEGHYVSMNALSEEAMRIWGLSQYQFDAFKKLEDAPRILCLPQKSLESTLTFLNGHFLIRDLINMPANYLGPSQLSHELEKMAKRFDARFQSLEGEGLLKEGFQAIHAVGRAANDAPRLLSLEWGKRDAPTVMFVGKGVCFDSGGLDIKPSSAMRLMKKDMGGAAHVMGLAAWIMENKLPIHLFVVIPAVENAVSGHAYRPGDVIVMRNGVSVEIDNTDAEGRLVMAEAFFMAETIKPELLIDFSTLTGAARVAVGTEIAAMFTNDEAIFHDLQHAAAVMRDPIWRLPLYQGYKKMLSSTIADLVNASPSSYAGAITAALFLEHFVPKNTSWLHFDIHAWNVSTRPGCPEGGEAMGYYAVLHFLKSRYEKGEE